MGPDGAQIMVNKPGTGGVLLIISSYVNANLSDTQQTVRAANSSGPSASSYLGHLTRAHVVTRWTSRRPHISSLMCCQCFRMTAHRDLF